MAGQRNNCHLIWCWVANKQLAIALPFQSYCFRVALSSRGKGGASNAGRHPSRVFSAALLRSPNRVRNESLRD
eukprot:1110012-Alexandrium_andersonii.AAC.1